MGHDIDVQSDILADLVDQFCQHRQDVFIETLVRKGAWGTFHLLLFLQKTCLFLLKKTGVPCYKKKHFLALFDPILVPKTPFCVHVENKFLQSYTLREAGDP